MRVVKRWHRSPRDAPSLDTLKARLDGATWCSWRCLCWFQGGLDKMSFKSPFQPVLWFLSLQDSSYLLVLLVQLLWAAVSFSICKGYLRIVEIKIIFSPSSLNFKLCINWTWHSVISITCFSSYYCQISFILAGWKIPDNGWTRYFVSGIWAPPCKLVPCPDH